MKNNTISNKKISSYLFISLFLCSIAIVPIFVDTMHMSDKEFFSHIDLNYPGLEEVKNKFNQNDLEGAKEEYVRYKAEHPFINPYPISGTTDTVAADLVVNHDIVGQSEIYHLEDGTRYFSDLDGELALEPWSDINWHCRPVSDNEYTYVVNRFNFFTTLAQTYLGTGNEIYAQEFVKMFLDWYEDEPQGHKEYTWRTIDTAIRLETMISVYEIFENSSSFTTNIKFKFYKSIWEQADYLHTFMKTSGNWGLIETNAIMWARCFLPEIMEAESWEQKGWEVSKIITDLNLLADGVHDERATMYHNIVVDMHLSYFRVLMANNFEIDPYIFKRAEDACNFTMDIIATTGDIMPFGDSDAIDDRYLLRDAASLFDREDFRYVGTNGEEGTFPDHTSIGYRDAGYYIMRSGWDKHSTCLMFDAGPKGTAHSHLDCLSFSLNAFGQELLLDPGRGTYDDTHPEKAYLKSNLAHNLFIIDGKEVTVEEPDSNSWFETSTLNYASGIHSAFGMPVSRQVLFPGPNHDYYLIFDSIEESGDVIHEIDNYMQFYDPALQEIEGGFQSQTPALGYITTYSPQTWIDTRILVNSSDPLAGIYSPQYNEYQSCATTIQSASVRGKASWSTALLCDSSNNQSNFSITPLLWSSDQNQTPQETNDFEENVNALSITHQLGKETIIWNNRDDPIYWNNWEIYPGISVFSYSNSDELQSISLINSQELKYQNTQVIKISDTGNYVYPLDTVPLKYVVCNNNLNSNTYIDDIIASNIDNSNGVIEIE